MKPTVAVLFRDARQNIVGNRAGPGSGDWSALEIAATVNDYLVMLKAELAGQPYSKAAHRRALLPRLSPARTAAAVEFKHQNISAVMLGLGLPYIRGYKPMSNYQAALTSEIQRHLEADPHLLRALREGTSVGTPSGSPLQPTAPPSPRPGASSRTGPRAGRHLDYGALDEENRRRGRQGEELVADYERSWLRQHGRPDLAGRVRWTAREDGDGLGYDVLSYDLDGHKRYIEVKTTRLGAETPFYITSAELDFAQVHPDCYALYRVYDVLGQPRFFTLEGDISNAIELTATTYRAQIASAVPATSPLGDA